MARLKRLVQAHQELRNSGMWVAPPSRLPACLAFSSPPAPLCNVADKDRQHHLLLDALFPGVPGLVFRLLPAACLRCCFCPRVPLAALLSSPSLLLPCSFVVVVVVVVVAVLVPAAFRFCCASVRVASRPAPPPLVFASACALALVFRFSCCCSSTTPSRATQSTTRKYDHLMPMSWQLLPLLAKQAHIPLH